jgi:hypothetical protein
MVQELALAILDFTKTRIQLAPLATLLATLALIAMPVQLVPPLLFKLSIPAVFVRAHLLCSITQLSIFVKHATIDARPVH